MSDQTTILLRTPGECSVCGLPLPSDSPPGLCPACLTLRASAGHNPTMHVTVRLGDYELLGALGQGGMGAVYRARDLKLKRTVALKMILSGPLATDTEVERFRVEAEAAARLEHPGIVPIYEVGEATGRRFFTMQLIEGGNLREVMGGKPMESARATQLVAKVARATHYAHQHGVLHRDIKPNNILLDTRGEPLLSDFGLAKISDREAAVTHSLAVMGSACYMAPEQARGDAKHLTTAADTYSLGAVLYETLTGQPPFSGETVVETLRQVVGEEPQRPSRLNPTVDRDLETICLKCLEKDPTRRYSSSEQLALDLERWLRREPVLARPVSGFERVRKWGRRKPAQAALGVVVGVALAALFGVRLYYNHQAHERLRGLLIEQARAERLLNHRERSLELLGQAAELKRDSTVRAEAIQTITQPGVREAFDVPFGSFATTRFSPDGKLLAAGGDVPDWREDRVVPVPRVRVWEVPSGRVVGETDWNVEGGPFAFNPDSRVLAVPQGSNSVALWDPRTGAIRGRLAIFGAPVFSPDGIRLAVSDARGVTLFNATSLARTHHRRGRATVLAFLSSEMVLLHEWTRRLDGEVRRWNFVAGTEQPLNGKNVLPTVSADGRVASLLQLNDLEVSNRLLLCETTTSAEIARLAALQPHAGGLLSPDGRRIAFASPIEPGRFLIWDVPSARFLDGVGEPGVGVPTAFEGFRHVDTALITDYGNTLRPESPWPSAANCFSHADAFFAGGSHAGERNLSLWELGTGRPIATLPRATRPVWSADDRWLAVEHQGEVVLRSTNYFSRQTGNVRAQVWEVRQGTATYRLPGQIRSLVFSADGCRIGAEDTLWSVEQRDTGALLQRLASSQPHEVIRFASNTAWTVEASPYRNSARTLFRSLEGLTNRFEPVPLGLAVAHAFAPDGRRLLIACLKDPAATPSEPLTTMPHFQLWDLVERRRLAVWPHPPVPTTSVFHEKPGPLVFSPDGHFAAAACFLNNGVEIWDTVAGRQISHLAPAPRIKGRKLLGFSIDWLDARQNREHLAELQVAHIAFTPDSKLVVYCAQEYAIVREVTTGRLVSRIRAAATPILCLALSPDGGTLATGTGDRAIRLWEIPGGRELAHWEAHESTVAGLAFNPDGNLLATGSIEGTLRLWDLTSIRRELAALHLGW